MGSPPWSPGGQAAGGKGVPVDGWAGGKDGHTACLSGGVHADAFHRGSMQTSSSGVNRELCVHGEVSWVPHVPSASPRGNQAHRRGYDVRDHPPSPPGPARGAAELGAAGRVLGPNPPPARGRDRQSRDHKASATLVFSGVRHRGPLPSGPRCGREAQFPCSVPDAPLPMHLAPTKRLGATRSSATSWAGGQTSPGAQNLVL